MYIQNMGKYKSRHTPNKTRAQHSIDQQIQASKKRIIEAKKKHFDLLKPYDPVESMKRVSPIEVPSLKKYIDPEYQNPSSVQIDMK